jgi:hypothetical protein
MSRSISPAAWILTVTLVLCVWVTSTAEGAQKVRVEASFKPETLGAATTVSLGFQVSTNDGRLPAPLTAIAFQYPRNLGFATSGLGLDS